MLIAVAGDVVKRSSAMRSSFLLAVLTLVACALDYGLDDTLTLAHAQVKGTHNSYHVAPPDNVLPPWRVTQAPLDVQLDEQGVRALELDLHWPPGAEALEVFHIAGYDEASTCRLFVDCLQLIETWSSAHPRHLPIAIQLELKDGFDPADAETFFARLDLEILSVFARERIITPDEVRGEHATLRDAVARGWPTLSVTRGRVFFFFDNGAEVIGPYTRGGANLDGRLAFVKSSPDDPYAAVAVLNDPIGQAADIARALDAGMLVRTRADSDSDEPLADDDRRMKAALASGAHIVSTDYPAKMDLDYVLVLPAGQPARCNPVTAPDACASDELERPDLLLP